MKEIFSFSILFYKSFNFLQIQTTKNDDVKTSVFSTLELINAKELM